MVINCKQIVNKIIKDYALYVLEKKTHRKLIDETVVDMNGLKLYRIKQTEKDIKV